MPIKGNKGEWSEFYVFLKLLIDKKLFAADEQLNINESVFYTILKIFRQEAENGQFIYSFTDNENIFQLETKNGTEFVTIDKTHLKNKVAEILLAIKIAKKTFTLPCAEEILEQLRCSQIKAAHNNKADIVLSVNDAMGGIQTEVGYSIKSMIGGASTLFNSSGATNFVIKS
jgi:type II restriction enzyme